jgi:predicted Zn-dependent protease
MQGDSPGRFNDGRTAASRAVMVRALATGIEIRGADGFLVAVWAARDLVAEPGAAGEVGIRLSCTAEPGARLFIPDARFAQDLMERELIARPTTGRRLALLAVLGSMLGAGMLLGLYWSLPSLSRAAVGLLPLSTEMSWGRTVAGGLERQLPACDAEPGSRALAKLVTKLSAGLPAGTPPVGVVVLYSSTVNALAFPGARVVVFKGMIDLAQDPDELAGVLAHEFTHVAQRHPAAAMIRAMGVGALAAMITGDASGMVASATAGLMAASYSRDDEEAADRGGAALMRAAGIGTGGMARMFRHLDAYEKARKQALPAWLSSHPDTEARAVAIERAPDPRNLSASLDEQEWRAIKDICRPR